MKREFKGEYMNKVSKILMIGLVLFAMVQTATALSEGKDYTCVDKGDVKSPPTSHRNVEIVNDVQKPLCSDGKVPKSLYKDTMSEVKLPEIKSTETLRDSTFCSGGKCFDWVYSNQFVDNKGVFAYITQHSPEIDPVYGISSCASIYSGDGSNRVGVGWCKTKNDYTRLDVYWWKYNSYQCHNFDCGWVQTNSYYYPGMPISTDGYSRSYEVFFDGSDWWLIYNGNWLGYYPGYLWDYGFNSGNEAVYRGIVANYAPTTTTDMGNGLWASNPYAASMDTQEYLDAASGYWYDAITDKFASNPSLYSVLSTSSNSMRYGGPGKVGGITVSSPNGGENWIKGTTNTITWTSSGSVGSYVKIELLKSGVLNRVISYSTANDGSFSWYIPSDQVLGTDFKVRITSTSNTAISDSSNNNFKISTNSPTITVISPNGGESWARGSTKLITWTYSGSPGSNVKIQLYKSGVLKATINSYTANDGSYSWSIPWSLPIGADYKIKITSTSNSMYNDWSNNNFKIY